MALKRCLPCGERFFDGQPVTISEFNRTVLVCICCCVCFVLVSIGISPSITVRPQNETVAVGTNVQIHCEASGAPTPTLAWSRGNKSSIKFSSGENRLLKSISIFAPRFKID